MRTEIKELHERLKTTTVYVTHDQIEAMTMADRIVILRDGYIEQVGTPLDVYDRPANLFVAEFIGSPAMNLLRGVVGKASVTLDSGIDISLPKTHGARPGQKVVLGIRPEYFRLGKGVSATVTVTEPTGPDTHIYADLGGSEICAITQERVSLARGDTIGLSPLPDRIHLFDADTGKAIA
jgi:multiple sugar transport system ATP-binding protein